MNNRKQVLLRGLFVTATLGMFISSIAAEKTITVTGEILLNEFDSGVDTEEVYGGVLFWNDSKPGRAILSVCKHGDICEITGVVDDKEKIKEFLSVSKVRKIHAHKK